MLLFVVGVDVDELIFVDCWVVIVVFVVEYE